MSARTEVTRASSRSLSSAHASSASLVAPAAWPRSTPRPSFSAASIASSLTCSMFAADSTARASSPERAASPLRRSSSAASSDCARRVSTRCAVSSASCAACVFWPSTLRPSRSDARSVSSWDRILVAAASEVVVSHWRCTCSARRASCSATIAASSAVRSALEPRRAAAAASEAVAASARRPSLSRANASPAEILVASISAC
mmetsp:Transcript_21465/g.53065  ORF Transcript_21465/g.53065 Transcript_21465/m.53065 type:complete len:203 (-) Transcript_21465:3199-3807(-)